MKISKILTTLGIVSSIYVSTSLVNNLSPASACTGPLGSLDPTCKGRIFGPKTGPEYDAEVGCPHCNRSTSQATVTFVSNQNGICEWKRNNGWTDKFAVSPVNRPTFNVRISSQIRCSLKFDPMKPGHTTFLTYFQINSSGTYDLYTSRVSCRTCTGSNWRWATIVTFPNGSSDYSFKER